MKEKKRFSTKEENLLISECQKDLSLANIAALMKHYVSEGTTGIGPGIVRTHGPANEFDRVKCLLTAPDVFKNGTMTQGSSTNSVHLVFVLCTLSVISLTPATVPSEVALLSELLKGNANWNRAYELKEAALSA